MAFIRLNCATWDYNNRQLQGSTSDVCGKYCCLFALYADRRYASQQFVSMFVVCNADRQVEQLFAAEFGAELPKSRRLGSMLPQLPIKGRYLVFLSPFRISHGLWK
jgi:hypothetical protein